MCSKIANMRPEWLQIKGWVENTILNTFRTILDAFRPFIGHNSNIRIMAGLWPGYGRAMVGHGEWMLNGC